jgi:hypothetical protein
VVRGGARWCGKQIRIQDSSNLGIVATVVDECGDCDNEVGASAHIRRNFRLDPSLGEVSIDQLLGLQLKPGVVWPASLLLSRMHDAWGLSTYLNV